MLTCYEQTIGQRRIVEGHRTAITAGASQAQGRASPGRQSSGVDRDHLCVKDGHALGTAAPGDGLQQRGDLLETTPRLAGGSGLGPVAPDTAGSLRGNGPDRFAAGLAGRSECARKKGGGTIKPGRIRRIRAMTSSAVGSSWADAGSSAASHARASRAASGLEGIAGWFSGRSPGRPSIVA